MKRDGNDEYIERIRFPFRFGGKNGMTKCVYGMIDGEIVSRQREYLSLLKNFFENYVEVRMQFLMERV